MYADPISSLILSNCRYRDQYLPQENENRKAVPQKIGMASVMRNGEEYEFTTVFDLDTNHQPEASKDRTQLFGDRIFQITEEDVILMEKESIPL